MGGFFVVLGDFFGWLVLVCLLFFVLRWIQQSTHLEKSHTVLIDNVMSARTTTSAAIRVI